MTPHSLPAFWSFASLCVFRLVHMSDAGGQMVLELGTLCCSTCGLARDLTVWVSRVSCRPACPRSDSF